MKYATAGFTIETLRKRTSFLLAAGLAAATMVLAGGLLFAAAVDSAVLRTEARRIAVIEKARPACWRSFRATGKAAARVW